METMEANLTTVTENFAKLAEKVAKLGDESKKRERNQSADSAKQAPAKRVKGNDGFKRVLFL